MKILTPLQKLPNNVDNLGKIIVATGFEKLPNLQKIAQSGHNVSGDVIETLLYVRDSIEILQCIGGLRDKCSVRRNFILNGQKKFRNRT